MNRRNYKRPNVPQHGTLGRLRGMVARRRFAPVVRGDEVIIVEAQDRNTFDQGRGPISIPTKKIPSFYLVDGKVCRSSISRLLDHLISVFGSDATWPDACRYVQFCGANDGLCDSENRTTDVNDQSNHDERCGRDENSQAPKGAADVDNDKNSDDDSGIDPDGEETPWWASADWTIQPPTNDASTNPGANPNMGSGQDALELSDDTTGGTEKGSNGTYSNTDARQILECATSLAHSIYDILVQWSREDVKPTIGGEFEFGVDGKRLVRELVGRSYRLSRTNRIIEDDRVGDGEFCGISVWITHDTSKSQGHRTKELADVLADALFAKGIKISGRKGVHNGVYLPKDGYAIYLGDRDVNGQSGLDKASCILVELPNSYQAMGELRGTVPRNPVIQPC